MTGVGGDYQVVDFDYDFASFTATWTLDRPITADRVLLDLSDDVSDLRGNALDGEWTDNASVYPSGDAVAGGDFQFSISALAGEVNNDGVVDRADVAILATNFGAGSEATTAEGDLDGDGAVTVRDALLLKRNLGQSLPAAAQAAMSISSNQSPQRVRAADAVFENLAQSPSEDVRASRAARRAARRHIGGTRADRHGVRDSSTPSSQARRLASTAQRSRGRRIRSVHQFAEFVPDDLGPAE